MTYSNICWDSNNNSGFTISGATITPQHVNPAWDNHIISENTNTASASPKIKITADNMDSWNVGLAYDPITGSSTHAAIEYGVHMNDVGQATARASGSVLTTLKSNCTTSDVFEVEILTTGCKWYVNGVLEHTITSGFGSTTFYAQATCKSTGTNITVQYENMTAGSCSGGSSGGGSSGGSSTPGSAPTDDGGAGEYLLYLNTYPLR